MVSGFQLQVGFYVILFYFFPNSHAILFSLQSVLLGRIFKKLWSFHTCSSPGVEKC